MEITTFQSPWEEWLCLKCGAKTGVTQAHHVGNVWIPSGHFNMSHAISAVDEMMEKFLELLSTHEVWMTDMTMESSFDSQMTLQVRFIVRGPGNTLARMGHIVPDGRFAQLLRAAVLGSEDEVLSFTEQQLQDASDHKLVEGKADKKYVLTVEKA